MKDDFLEFQNSGAKVPVGLHSEALDYMKVSLNPKKTILRFYTLQLFGMFLTLFVCPQYGFSSIGFHGISSWVMNLGQIPCAVFCSTVMFLGGIIVSYSFLRKSQIRWISNNSLLLVIPFNSLVFMIMMLTKNNSLDHHSASHSSVYDIIWLVTSFMVTFLAIKLMKRFIRRSCHIA